MGYILIICMPCLTSLERHNVRQILMRINVKAGLVMGLAGFQLVLNSDVIIFRIIVQLNFLDLCASTSYV